MKLPALNYLPLKDTAFLPAACGVYFFLNEKKEILYIGKSTNICKRIRDHLRSLNRQANDFKQRAIGIGWIETETEIEALLKEAELVKRWLPKGNILLKDDKKYFYVVVLPQRPDRKLKGLPYVTLSHQPHTFTGKLSALQVVGPFTEGKAIKKILRYLRKIFPYYSAPHHGTRLCSYCHLGLCPGPAPEKKTYRTHIATLIKVLQGKYRAVEKKLAKQMDDASRFLDFEKAQQTKETLQALEQIFAHKDFLTSKQELFQEKQHTKNAGKFLQEIFGITHEVSSIEGYDISNIQGHEPTASMVRFENGLPNKNLYRKFHIRLPETPNDFAMMREVLARRLAHPEWPYPDLILIDGGKGQLNAAQSAMHSFFLSHPEERPRMPLIASIAKHYNELFIPSRKNSLKLDTDVDSSVRNLLMYVRDESHRFAISYHRKLHRKKFTQST